MNLPLQMLSVNHQYGKKTILKDLSLQLEHGQIGCLLGPSASGKTTILRTIAGFEDILSGKICIHGDVVSQLGFTKPVDQRHVGIVFQDYALFPHLNVEQNIRFGLRGIRRDDINARVQKWIDLVGLRSVAHQYPHELSGGESQRVAIARAMAPQPKLLLLDEPFSNLDLELRERLSVDVRNILKQNQMTALMVTHDQYEAFSVADKVGVLNGGRLEQWGSPYELYHEPANPFVADFIGQGVFVPADVIDEWTLKTEVGALKTDRRVTCKAGTQLEILLRPDDILHDDASEKKARVVHKAFRGAFILYTLALRSGQTILSYVPSHHNHAIGEDIGIRLEADHVIYFHC